MTPITRRAHQMRHTSGGMRCRGCGRRQTEVIDTRTSEDGTQTRRRRRCACGRRFTTHEIEDDAVMATYELLKILERRSSADLLLLIGRATSALQKRIEERWK